MVYRLTVLCRRVDKSILGIVSEFGSFLLSWASLVVFRAQSVTNFMMQGSGGVVKWPLCLQGEVSMGG